MAKSSRPQQVPSLVRPIGRQVGERVSALRRQLGLTLDDLAAGAGLASSYLSRLERGRTSISVDNLRGIAHALGVEMVYFFERDARAPAVLTRKGTGARLRVGKTTAVAENLVGSSRSVLQATMYRTPPGEGRSIGFAHPGEELVVLLRGSLQYVVGSEAYDLAEGDALWHPSTEPHRWTNRGRSTAVSLHVNTPPVW